MEKASNTTSSSIIVSTIKNITLNTDITITKINELINSLKKASSALIVPVLKLEKKIQLKLESFLSNYKEIKNKTESALKEINLNEQVNNTMNITDIQLNQKYANEHEEFIIFYDNVGNAIELFTKLFQSEQFISLLNGFEVLVKDEDVFDKSDMDELENMKNNSLKIKSGSHKKKSTKKGKENKTKLKSLGGNRKKLSNKNINNASNVNKKKKASKDLLEIIQNEFPSSSYVQKISQTFLKRRLFKKVIYKHIFKYNNTDHSCLDDRSKSSGESTVYKYSRMRFVLPKEKEVKEKCKEIVKRYLKSSFVKEVDDNVLIIGGRINCSLNELIDNLFKSGELSKECNVSEVDIEFYEFYEELIGEFIEEGNYDIQCDEKIIKNCLDDWTMLKKVRMFVEDYRKDKGKE